ncbi:YbhB/YbcL family Raf kinase inhibitor-like protein [Nocardiopsis ansamitocini]|uniref:YbhB/YbcL family Raf kinase inhibitor-like protein n=1 Tax=Nocardiopsis ansamitocini TaxID=1670832 RepID=A0A9W6P8Q3_9ACTN|nr:YbhB/YbcL family Raf kinase inhibitor-like protein [Nocardiopsis ansamitocini]GLU49056.1 hypothetical protein Nans01_34070 [Nocardiopsis ansamitocini]
MFAFARHLPVGERVRRLTATGGAAVTLAALTTGCGVLIETNNGETTDDITVTSPMLQEGEAVPERYTCAGDGASPPLSWSGLPTSTESLALIVDDPEAVGGATVHWVVYGIDPSETQIPEGGLPLPSQQGQNSFEEAAYAPLCPQEGREHEFRFTVYALSKKLELSDGAPLDEALGAIAAHTLARGRLMSVSDS